MIELRAISKSFGRLEVLKGLDVVIKEGIITAILGPNGSGKTTLIKSLLGLVIPDEGEIMINGEITARNHLYRRNIGYLPQIARFPENLKVIELIKMVEDVRKQKSEYAPLVERFAMGDYLNKKIRNLSGGTRQKVNLVLAFMFDSPLYILDEPTSGLDPVALIQLKELIQELKKNGKSFLVTTHIMSLVEELADEMIFLLEGEVYFAGTWPEMQKEQNEQTLERAIAKILVKENVKNS